MECVICYDTAPQTIAHTECNHLFCEACLIQCAQQSNKVNQPLRCPTCRTPVKRFYAYDRRWHFLYRQVVYRMIIKYDLYSWVEQFGAVVVSLGIGFVFALIQIALQGLLA